jgi:hypothetical protein
LLLLLLSLPFTSGVFSIKLSERRSCLEGAAYLSAVPAQAVVLAPPELTFRKVIDIGFVGCERAVLPVQCAPQVHLPVKGNSSPM